MPSVGPTALSPPLVTREHGSEGSSPMPAVQWWLRGEVVGMGHGRVHIEVLAAAAGAVLILGVVPGCASDAGEGASPAVIHESVRDAG